MDGSWRGGGYGGGGTSRVARYHVRWPAMMALVVLLALGGAGGFALYEFLVKRYAPPRVGRGGVRAGLSRTEKPGSEAPSTRGEGGLDAVEARGSSVLAMLVSAAGRIERVLPMTRSDGETYRALLARAGWSLEPETWRGVRVVCAAFFGLLAGLSIAGAGGEPFSAGALVAVASAVGWTAPRAVLARAVVMRRRAIEAQLPDAMELLGIAIAAGSPVEQCFREVAQNVGQPLAGEFEAVDREVNLLGHSRDQALGHLAQRCASRDVSAFVTQLALAVNQGSSIAESLSAQAALARQTAQAALLERIRKMPTKLDLVLSFCFLPPTIALVVVPTVADLLKFLNDTLQ
ncbi:type II secretion system F family protein [Gordonibacter sp.]|uniref:type II secretion system F family protein n=1 Tax=Gordonibacter sp. TaxID=1968902 RepID=UPI002FC7C3DE